MESVLFFVSLVALFVLFVSLFMHCINLCTLLLKALIEFIIAYKKTKTKNAYVTSHIKYSMLAFLCLIAECL